MPLNGLDDFLLVPSVHAMATHAPFKMIVCSY